MQPGNNWSLWKEKKQTNPQEDKWTQKVIMNQVQGKEMFFSRPFTTVSCATSISTSSEV